MYCCNCCQKLDPSDEGPRCNACLEQKIVDWIRVRYEKSQAGVTFAEIGAHFGLNLAQVMACMTDLVISNKVHVEFGRMRSVFPMGAEVV